MKDDEANSVEDDKGPELPFDKPIQNSYRSVRELVDRKLAEAVVSAKSNKGELAIVAETDGSKQRFLLGTSSVAQLAENDRVKSEAYISLERFRIMEQEKTKRFTSSVDLLKSLTSKHVINAVVIIVAITMAAPSTLEALAPLLNNFGDYVSP